VNVALIKAPALRPLTACGDIDTKKSKRTNELVFAFRRQSGQSISVSSYSNSSGVQIVHRGSSRTQRNCSHGVGSNPASSVDAIVSDVSGSARISMVDKSTNFAA
jgi:hypothetical protein